MAKWVVVIGLAGLLAASGCSDDGTVTPGNTGIDAGFTDGTGGGAGGAGGTGGNPLLDIPTEPDPDVPGNDSEDDVPVTPDEGAPDEGEPDTGEPCDGFGCACNSNADCLDEYCVEGPDGFVCTQPCVTECPDGWACVSTTGFGPDPVSICLPQHVRLCRPCDVNDDCQSDLEQQPSFCLPATDPNDGSFCGSSCENGLPCPEDYACVTVEAGGATAKQCVPVSGQCECRDSWVGKGYETTCAIENDFGACAGTRTCGPAGLTSCEGALPKAETCNGLDDDCDGETDDIAGESCTVDNEFGSCPGVTICTAEGETQCEGESALPESCNGIDDDCDGLTDEDTCDDGVECTQNVCTPDLSCINPLAEGWCLIEGGCVEDGGANPADPCEQCLSGLSTSQWSDADGLPCNDGEACTWQDACAAGTCSGTPYVCNDGLGCTDDVCDGDGGCEQQLVPGFCQIDGACLADGATNGSQPCQVCDATASPKAWLPNEGGACDDGDLCTSGDVCSGLSCAGTPYDCDDGDACTVDSCLGDGTCENAQAAGTCIIDGVCYAAGTPKPDESCLACRPEISGLVWSPVEPGTDCDDGLACTAGDSCTAGVCQGTPYICDDDLGCTSDACNGDGSCTFTVQAGSCAISGTCYEEDNLDPGNSCRVCDPDAATDAWTDLSPGSPCSDGNDCTFNDSCSGGSCSGTGQNCDDGLWCTVDNCDGSGGCTHVASGGCLIGGTCYSNGASNPGDSCEACNIDQSTTGWSPATGPSCNDGQACTFNDTCQAGACIGVGYDCNDSLTCTTDSCDGDGSCTNQLQGSKCLIGGVCYDSLDPNPSNPCLRCLSSNPNTWSNNNGVSCNDGNSCTNNDTCSSGSCSGSYIEDGFEPNDSSGAAKALGSKNDTMDWPEDAGSFSATLYGPGDVDYYSFVDNDVIGGLFFPRVDLSVPSGQNYKLCASFVCKEGTLDVEKFECASGEKASPNTCCSDNPGSQSESVRLSPVCDCGTFCADDSGTITVEVTKAGSTNWTCSQYTVTWGDD